MLNNELWRCSPELKLYPIAPELTLDGIDTIFSILV
jgi:hypothetical protein